MTDNNTNPYAIIDNDQPSVAAQEEKLPEKEQSQHQEEQPQHQEEVSQRQGEKQHQEQKAKEEQPQHQEDRAMADSFWHRFSSIPIVQDSVDKVQQYPLGRYALKQAETTWTRASTQAHALPYAQAYFEKAGALGCFSLDVLEQRFPVVYQPTEQIVDSVKRSSGQVRDSLITKVTAPVHHAVSLLWMPGQDKRTDELAHLSALLQETANNIAKINDSLRGWTTCVANQVGSQIKGSYESTQAAGNQRILELTAELVSKLDAASAYAKTVHIPPVIQTRLEPFVAFYDRMRAEAVKDELTPLQKASKMVLLTQGCVLPALQSSIDGIQEQLKYLAAMSKGKVVGEIKGQLNSLGIHA
ncbi:hypothetical protein BJV82DRAFT_578811 [Fennellomyces sp. T-0311]|nr:hypothetical protein BJV82DRAFT_578811 [Fennellomyces sp. T-0311]